MAAAQDNCNSAVPISAGLYTVEVINGNEIPNPICAANGNNATAGEWYQYTAPQNAFVTITTDLQQNSGGDTRFHVYTGTCGALTCYAGDDDAGVIGNGYLSIDSFDVIQGTTYYIAFDNNWNSGGFDFELIEGEPPPPPPISFDVVPISTSGSNLAVVDLNGDFLDDIVSISSTNVNVQFQVAEGGFTMRNISTPQANYTPSWSFAAGDLNADGYNDLLYGSGSGVTFMTTIVDPENLNNGDAFDDVSGFTETSGNQYVFSQRSNFVDINNDGSLDAFVCHDVAPNVFYLNDGLGNLAFNQGGLGDYPSGGNYGSIWIDYDNDHDLDMFIAKCGGEVARRTNQMHTNNGDGTFTENAAAIGLADPMQTWSSAWGDFDNDGDMDVFVGASSGYHKLMENDNFIFNDITTNSGVNSIPNNAIENVTYDFDNDGNLDLVSGGNVFMGNGDLTFTVYPNILPGSGGAYGDLNNDGKIDAFNGSMFLNNTVNSNNWVKVNTIGTVSNLNGIGARVEVHTSSGIRIRDVRSGEGFRYMNSLNTHVGLGTEDAINNIIIYWPSGIVDNLPLPAVNSTHTIIEGETLGLEEASLLDVIIHPNPVKDLLHISSSQNLSNAKLFVFDISGKMILRPQLFSNELDVSQLSSGHYVLKIMDNAKVRSHKFIKE
ncbi:MAG: VCBS repeat-containing protein [Bacteroidia bacterium]|nr:VCBS repeat-containing protein [Bacteroidia bacterium]